jgi:hypothetical protein
MEKPGNLIRLESKKLHESNMKTWVKLKDFINMKQPVLDSNDSTDNLSIESISKRTLHKQLKKRSRAF